MKSNQVDFLPLLKKLPGSYPSWRQTFFILLLLILTYSYVMRFGIIKSQRLEKNVLQLRLEVSQLNNEAKLYFPKKTVGSKQITALTKYNIHSNVSFSNQLEKVQSYLKPGIWLQAVLFDHNFQFTRLQGMAISTQGLSQFYETILAKNEIIGLPFKVVFIGKIGKSAVEQSLTRQRTLGSSVGALDNAVSQYRNRMPQTEKRLQQIPFLFQTNKLSARFSEFMRYRKRR